MAGHSSASLIDWGVHGQRFGGCWRFELNAPPGAHPGTTRRPRQPMIDFNINDYVYVRLTEKGRAILHSQSMSAPAENENGFGKWQLWCLMNTFGPHLCNGAKVPFETTIKITHPTQPPQP
jgi:hypothetical protein